MIGHSSAGGRVAPSVRVGVTVSVTVPYPHRQTPTERNTDTKGHRDTGTQRNTQIHTQQAHTHLIELPVAHCRRRECKKSRGARRRCLAPLKIRRGNNISFFCFNLDSLPKQLSPKRRSNSTKYDVSMFRTAFTTTAGHPPPTRTSSHPEHSTVR